MYSGNMMHIPLLISSILTHAIENSPDREIMTALDDGGMHVYAYRDLGKRAKELAAGMQGEGISVGEYRKNKPPFRVLAAGSLA